MYPTISEYLEAIKSAKDNFDQLKHLRPVLDDDGQPASDTIMDLLIHIKCLLNAKIDSLIDMSKDIEIQKYEIIKRRHQFCTSDYT